jgi:3-hydroxyacyl-[acyl-carrier-protein] dehydratase/UDP-3-O-[3-hydroxymyristoyl] N-acetylglucosamine deacetylase/3-hydroxyacyl-[acyl-carrier-protein] dehydratase
MDIEKILEHLPHRYPFLLVDRVLEVEAGESIVALKNVTINEPFFQGHFPGRKVMPGVLIIESLAQAGGVLLYHSIPDAARTLVFLSKVNNAKFRRPVVPGDQLILKVRMSKLKHRFCQIVAKAYVDDEVVAEAEIMASFVDLEEMDGKP